MSGPTEIDKLIESYQELAGTTEEISRDIKATEVPAEEDPDAVIKAGAENLSAFLRAAGLPHQEPAEIESQIKRRRRSLSSE